MSGRAYEKRELRDWGYVALVCSALGFTTLTTIAGPEPSDPRPYVVEKGDVCSLKKTSHLPLAACEEKPRPVTIHELQNALQAKFALPREIGWENHQLERRVQ